jgi:hypothetical protein
MNIQSPGESDVGRAVGAAIAELSCVTEWCPAGSSWIALLHSYGDIYLEYSASLAKCVYDTRLKLGGIHRLRGRRDWAL